VATGGSRTATTDGEGRYQIASVEPGNYEVRAALAGFRTAVRSGVVVTVGGTTEASLEMTVGQVAEEVTVQVEASLVESAKTDLSRVVTGCATTSRPTRPATSRSRIATTSSLARARRWQSLPGWWSAADTGSSTTG
jgi:hypothetical protein